jgi:hypothetical protein
MRRQAPCRRGRRMPADVGWSWPLPDHRFYTGSDERASRRTMKIPNPRPLGSLCDNSAVAAMSSSPPACFQWFRRSETAAIAQRTNICVAWHSQREIA